MANNARLRFMRLSEAAEKLRQQAALTVQAGKENEARELLLQKRKVMQALEKSKSRVELLDQLSMKLNQRPLIFLDRTPTTLVPPPTMESHNDL
ncbi:hypothetical protein ACLOJK_007639 [Asimina triloba]